ncbi:MAG: hypothetical protein LBB87_00555 [Nitrososphaerota archaeon]|jgi:hypothetical protein|nr:hypothetical protein [Nitrososphaerota archaeon]
MYKVFSLILLSFLIFGLFTAVASSVSASSELVKNFWNTKTSMSQTRISFGAVGVDGFVYAIGGFTKSGYLGTNERYDPIANTWTTLASMPTPRNDLAIVACQDKIYCIGGITSNGQGWFRCDVTEVYDTVTDSWSSKASLPVNGSNLQAHVVDEKIFVIAGQRLFMYDSTIDSWIQKNSAPHGVMVSAVSDDKIVAFYVVESHYLDDTSNVNVLIYDAKTDMWSEGKTQEIGVSGSRIEAAGATSGVYAPKGIYVLGLESFVTTRSVKQFTWFYDPINDVWSSAKAMSIPRYSFSVAVVDDILYAIGGSVPYTGIEFLAINERYVPIDYHTDPSHVTSPLVTPESSGSSKPFLTYNAVVALVILTVSIVVACLLVYFKKRKPV